MTAKYSNKEITQALWTLRAIECDETFGVSEGGYINLFDVAADANQGLRYVTPQDLSKLEQQALQYLNGNGSASLKSGKSVTGGEDFTL